MNLFKKSILPLVALLLAGCGPSGNSFKLEGSFRDMKGGQLYIYSLNDTESRFDTITIREGDFVYAGSVNKVTPYILVFPNAMEQVIFVGPGENITYKAAANDLRNYVVDGNDENELMNKFRKETAKLKDEDIRAKARIYIKENIASPVAIYLFNRYFLQDRSVSKDEVREILDLFKQNNQRSLFLLGVESSLRLTEKGGIGDTLPELDLITKEKDTIRTTLIEEPRTMFVFWATWMNHQYEFIGNLRKQIKAYKDNDSIRIISLSLDSEIYKWENSVRYDTVGVDNCCDGLVWDSPIVKELGITDIPTFILFDEEHRIISRGHTSEQMNKELEKNVPDNKDLKAKK